MEHARPRSQPSQPRLASSAAPPLQAAVSVATTLIGGNKNDDGATFADDGVGIPGGPAALAGAIERDFTNFYFVTGQINGAAYSPATAFIDPTITVRGVGSWRTNISALRRWFVDPSIELEGQGVEVVSDQPPTIVLRAAWRLKTGVALPWRPAVDVRGQTVYECEAVDGGKRLRVFRHTEAWRTPAWRAVAQLLVPGGGL